MTRLSDAEAELPLDGRCECGCGPLVCSRGECDDDCMCEPCPICQPLWFEDDDD